MMLLRLCQVFSSLQGHLHFFVHFFFTFMGQFFLGHPIQHRNNCIHEFSISSSYLRQVREWQKTEKQRERMEGDEEEEKTEERTD